MKPINFSDQERIDKIIKLTEGNARTRTFDHKTFVQLRNKAENYMYSLGLSQNQQCGVTIVIEFGDEHCFKSHGAQGTVVSVKFGSEGFVLTDIRRTRVSCNKPRWRLVNLPRDLHKSVERQQRRVWGGMA